MRKQSSVCEFADKTFPNIEIMKENLLIAFPETNRHDSVYNVFNSKSVL